MLLFGYRNGVPRCCDFGEALIFGDSGEFRVEVGVLLEFTHGCSQQVFRCCAGFACGETGGYFKLATFKKFEKSFGMFFFLAGGLLEDIGNLYESLLAGNGGKIAVAVARLALTRERFQQILFGFASFHTFHVDTS